MGPDAKYAAAALAEMLCDPDGYLRVTASHTLESLGADAIPALVVMLRAPDARARELAANTLQRIRANMELSAADSSYF
jgi:hypothetical protein